MKTFPHQLAVVLNQDYSEERKSSAVKVRFEKGISQQRPKNIRPEYEVRCRIHICTREAYLSFLDWYNCELNSGTDFFLFLCPIRKKYRRMRFKDLDLAFNVQAKQGGEIYAEANIFMETYGEISECSVCN